MYMSNERNTRCVWEQLRIYIRNPIKLRHCQAHAIDYRRKCLIPSDIPNSHWGFILCLIPTRRLHYKLQVPCIDVFILLQHSNAQKPRRQRERKGTKRKRQMALKRRTLQTNHLKMQLKMQLSQEIGLKR